MNQLRTGPEREEWLQDIREQTDEWVMADDVSVANAGLSAEEAAVAWQAVHEHRLSIFRTALADALQGRLVEHVTELDRLKAEIRAGEIAARVLARHGFFGEKRVPADTSAERDYRNMPGSRLYIGHITNQSANSSNADYVNLRNGIVERVGCTKDAAGRVASRLVDFSNLSAGYFSRVQVEQQGWTLYFNGTGNEAPKAEDLFSRERNIGKKTVETLLDFFKALGDEQSQDQAT